MIENGTIVKFEYILKVDGEVIGSTFDDNPTKYTHGKKEILPGLESALEGLNIGDEKKIIINPEDGLGLVDKRAYFEVPKENLPDDTEPKIGDVYALRSRDKKATQARVTEVKKETVILNCNHPLAGKTLHFKVKILEINEP